MPPANDARGVCGDDAWKTLVALVKELAVPHGVPADKTHVVTHSDAHPMARTGLGAPWDPPPTQWSWEMLAARLGA